MELFLQFTTTKVLFESITSHIDFIDLLETLSTVLKDKNLFEIPPYLLLAYFIELSSPKPDGVLLDEYLKAMSAMDLQLTHFDLGQLFDWLVAKREEKQKMFI